MVFDGFRFDDRKNLVVGSSVIDIHNYTPLRSYRYVAGHRRFELELEGEIRDHKGSDASISSLIKNHITFAFHDVGYLRVEAAGSEHLDSACFLEMREETQDRLRAEVAKNSAIVPDCEQPTGWRVHDFELEMYEGRLKLFGDQPLYSIEFIHGPDILLSTNRITVDWQIWSWPKRDWTEARFIPASVPPDDTS